jgi:hypothetical protein
MGESTLFFAIFELRLRERFPSVIVLNFQNPTFPGVRFLNPDNCGCLCTSSRLD